MAAGVVADRDVNVGKVFRALVRRVRRDEHAARVTEYAPPHILPAPEVAAAFTAQWQAADTSQARTADVVRLPLENALAWNSWSRPSAVR